MAESRPPTPTKKFAPVKKSIVSGGCHEFKELDILA
jgi:hypothetical protein